MSSKVCDIVIKELTPVIDALGYELVDAEYAKKVNGMNLTLFIFKPDGITITDCEKVHRTVDPLLDEINPTNDSPYILNVSSLGLDRPFKTQRDYERYMGKDIVIKLYVPIDKNKQFVGELKAVDDKEVTILVKGQPMTIQKEKIAVAEPHINF